MIYLDYAANTPAEPAVLERFITAERSALANPNAGHTLGRQAKAALAETTAHIAALLGVSPAAVVYTSGATESNNLAIKGAAAAKAALGRHILTTPLEHSSVRSCLSTLAKSGFEVEVLPLGADGSVDTHVLQKALRPDTILLTLPAVDSELGIVQPLEKIREVLASFPHCGIHLDATQLVGKLPFSFEGMDAVSLSAHKFYGLNGSGLLLKRPGLRLVPQMEGGASVTEYRSGTPTLALACALETALEIALEQQPRRTELVRQYNSRLRAELGQYPAVRINSPSGASPYLLNLSIENVMGAVVQRELDRRGICVSVQSACAGAGQPSQAVLALTGERRNALSSWRISLSHLTSPSEIEEFLSVFREYYQERTPLQR